MKIFIICTVRNATPEYLKKLENYVGELNAKGHTVHFPPRDTKQEDETGGYVICRTNMQGILWADEVHVSYNEKSTGTHFDLGMAFMSNKKIHVFDCPEIDESIPKSFPKMMRHWEKTNKMYKFNPSDEWYEKASEEEDSLPDFSIGERF